LNRHVFVTFVILPNRYGNFIAQSFKLTHGVYCKSLTCTTFGVSPGGSSALSDCNKKGIYDAWGKARLDFYYPEWRTLCPNGP